MTSAQETDTVRTSEVICGFRVASARSFRLLDEHVTNPMTEGWDRAFGLFRLPV